MAIERLPRASWTTLGRVPSHASRYRVIATTSFSHSMLEEA
jgi:hypothetical protein